VFADLERIAGRFPHAIGMRRRAEAIWCSNDYLGMGQHPKVIGGASAHAGRDLDHGGGTRNIAGNNHPVVELEHELADLHRKEAALVFTSGYVSNETGISTLAKLMPNCLILSDAWNHNWMIEGVRQAHTEKQIFRHNDMAQLEQLLVAEWTASASWRSGPGRTGRRLKTKLGVEQVFFVLAPRTLHESGPDPSIGRLPRISAISAQCVGLLQCDGSAWATAVLGSSTDQSANNQAPPNDRSTPLRT
jgi:hypothetical protein